MHSSAPIEPNGKGELTVPVQDIAKIAKRHVQVIATPEYNTTKLCAGCWKEAEKCGKPHQSIRCRSTECFQQRRRRRKDRDVNGCKNIRHVGISLEERGEVPCPFQRPCNQQCSS